MSQVIEEYLVKWGFNVDKGKLDSINKKVTQLNKGFKKVAMASGGAMVAISGVAGRMEKSVTHAMTMMDASGRDFDILKGKLQEFSIRVANDLNVSSQTIADSLYEVRSAGVDPLTDGFEELTKAGQKFAKAGDMQTGEAIKTLARVTQSFGRSMEFATDTANKLFMATQFGTVNIPELSEGMNDVATSAKEMQQSMSTTAAILAKLNSIGIAGTKAGTGLRMVFEQLGAQTPKATKALEEMSQIAGMNINLYDKQTGQFRDILNILSDFKEAQKSISPKKWNEMMKAIGQVQGGSVIRALMQGENIEDVKEWREELQNSAGYIDKAYQKAMNNLTDKTKGLFNSIYNLGAALGMVTEGPGKGFVGWLTEVIDKTTTWMNENPKIKKMTVYIIGLTAAISGLGVAVTAATLAFTTLGNAGLIANMKIMSTILLVIASLGILYLAVEDFIGFLIGRNSVFGLIVEEIKASFKDTMTIISEYWKTFTYWVKGKVNLIRVKIRNFLKYVFIDVPMDMLKNFLSTAERFIKQNAGFLSNLLFPDEMTGLAVNGAGAGGNLDSSKIVPASESVYNQSRNETRVENINVSVPEGYTKEDAQEITKKSVFEALEDYSREKERENPIKEKY